MLRKYMVVMKPKKVYRKLLNAVQMAVYAHSSVEAVGIAGKADEMKKDYRYLKLTAVKVSHGR